MVRAAASWIALWCGFFFTSAVASAQPLVVVDPGHGGRDPGAVGCGLQEADVVLDLSLRFSEALRARGAATALTREDDRFIELRSRAAFANERGAEAFVSVHANANEGQPATGSETYVSFGAGAAARTLAQAVQNALLQTWGLRDRGVKQANFSVLVNTAMPAALLELGFINRCDIDATLLADAQARQRMAEALADAVAVEVGAIPQEAEPGGLVGVVFEDRGAGLADPSVRVHGATVRVVETGDMSAADGAEAIWRFDVAPGAYTVEARAPGFEVAQRRCDVRAGQRVWCSVGMMRAQEGAEDAGVPPDMSLADAEVSDMGVEEPVPVDMGLEQIDAETPEVTDMGAEMPDAVAPEDAEVSEVDGGAISDAQMQMPAPDDEGVPADMYPEPQPDDGGPTNPFHSDGGLVGADGGSLGALTPGSVTRKSTTSSGCGVGQRAGTMGWLWVLVVCMGFFMSRRSAEGHTPDAPSEGTTAVGQEVAEPWARLGKPEPLVAGAFDHPLLSPDGAHVALSGPGGRGLSVMANTPGAPVRVLSTTPGAGIRPEWSPDGGVLGWRSPEQPVGAVPMLGQRVVDGEAVVPHKISAGHVWVEGDAIFWRGASGPVQVSPADLSDRFFGPQIAPDGAHVVFSGLRTGLFIYRVVDGTLMALGSGAHPTFGPTGRYLLFERTTDEGATLTGGDLFITDLQGAFLPTIPLTHTDDRIELSPTMAGGWVVYVADGVVYRAPIRFTAQTP
ncbi:MAG: N-acetylmuramoyl-L-alanine amidase [Bradymonadia bacterium]